MNNKTKINFSFAIEILGFVSSGYLFAQREYALGFILFILVLILAFIVGQQIREYGKREGEGNAQS